MRSPLHLSIDADLHEQLNQLVKNPGSSKSAIVSDALRDFLGRGATAELDDRLRSRLDKVSTHLNRLERHQRILIETVAVYIRFHFSVLPPMPESEQAAGRALAEERFQAFIEQVGRRLAGGRSVASDLFVQEAETQA
jgi:predicted transcriptional regulator